MPEEKTTPKAPVMSLEEYAQVTPVQLAEWSRLAYTGEPGAAQAEAKLAEWTRRHFVKLDSLAWAARTMVRKLIDLDPENETPRDTAVINCLDHLLTYVEHSNAFLRAAFADLDPADASTR